MTPFATLRGHLVCTALDVMIGRACIASVVFLVACTDAAPDDIWTPPISDGGKADGVQLVSGADIPSHYADPHKRYVASRMYSYLSNVGAFDIGIGWQLDGLVGQANARIELAELVRCEQLASCAQFPDSLRKVWTAMEAPDGPVAHIDGIPKTILEPEVTANRAIAMAPPLGQASTIAHLGASDLKCTSNISIHETRSASTSVTETSPYSWMGDLYLISSIDIQLAADPKDRFIFVSLDHPGWENLVNGPDGRLPWMLGGAYIVDRYRDGIRQESHIIAMPLVGNSQRSRFTQYLDYELVTPTGPLVKNVQSAQIKTGQAIVELEYATTAVAPSATDLVALDAVATPVSSLPVGHYEVPVPGFSTCDFDVYPNGLILWDGVYSFWWMSGSPLVKTLSNHNSTTDLEFVPSTNELHASRYPANQPEQHATVVVTPAMRVH